MSNVLSAVANDVRVAKTKVTAMLTAVAMPLAGLTVPLGLVSCEDATRSSQVDTVPSAKYTTIQSTHLKTGLPARELLGRAKLLEECKAPLTELIKISGTSSGDSLFKLQDTKSTITELQAGLKKLAAKTEDVALKALIQQVDKALVLDSKADLVSVTEVLKGQKPGLEKLLEVVTNDLDALTPGLEACTYAALGDNVANSKSAISNINDIMKAGAGGKRPIDSLALGRELSKLESASTEVLNLSNGSGAAKVKDVLVLLVSSSQALRSLCLNPSEAQKAWTVQVEADSKNSNAPLGEKIVSTALDAIKVYEQKVATLQKEADTYGHLVEAKSGTQTPVPGSSTTTHTHTSSGFFYYPWLFSHGGNYYSGSTYHNHSGYHTNSSGLRSVPTSHFTSGDYAKGYSVAEGGAPKATKPSFSNSKPSTSATKSSSGTSSFKSTSGFGSTGKGFGGGS